jgi:hypothetical protein
MPHTVALRTLAAALSCLALALAFVPARAQESQTSQAGGPATLLELSDTALIARAWETLFPDSLPPPGEFQVLIPAGPQLSSGRMESSIVFVLHNGTEAGHMDRGAWDALAGASPLTGESWAEAMEGPDNSEVPILWKALDWDLASVLERAEWPSGFLFAMGTSIASVRTSKPQYQRDMDFAWNQKLFNHLLLGVALHRTQYAGGLTRIGATVADTLDGDPPTRGGVDFSTEGFWWWSLTGGVPGLRYTLSLANRALPEWYWLETRAASAIRTQSRGRLVNQWNNETMDIPGNMAHTMDARYGILRYSMHWDGDAYRVPIQTLGFGDIHSLLGTWGAGLIIAGDILATKISLDIPDTMLELAFPSDWPTRFRFAFLHVDFAYRNTKNFNLGLSMRLRLENPIMNKPGA